MKQPYFYGESINTFLQDSENEILGVLERAHAENHTNRAATQNDAWLEEITLLKSFLSQYKGRGSVYFEYIIPRMGRYVDVILLIDGIVFILEFKAFNEHYNKSDIAQLWDYALDLHNFHEESHCRFIVPILVSTEAFTPKNSYTLFRDKLFVPLMANKETLESVIAEACSKSKHDEPTNSDEEWAKSRYSPTPTIIEAASALYLNHSVEEISRNGAGEENLTVTCTKIIDIIDKAKKDHFKAICFVTGVPGAGKTLVGLNIATEQFKKQEVAVYLSGNFPLVEVLTEALVRDKVAKEAELGNSITKAKAKSEVKTFIQMVHHYRDTCLNGAKVQDGEIVKDEKYFEKIENSDKNFKPVDHVAIFDEAQRAWTQAQLTNFMARKKNISGFPYSEPEYLISCLDRHDDWAVIICLVGGGQEINTGEAGISEWIEALQRRYKGWHVYISDKLSDKEYAAGKALQMLKESQINTFIEPSLHLSTALRSFKAKNLSLFIHQLLDLDVDKAKQTLSTLADYPILLTRDKDKAKQWLRDRRGQSSERCGIVASSAGDRLRPEEIVVRLKADVVHWFLDDEIDVRSSNFLEDVATEFDVQGLELDWVCVAWDGDFRYTRQGWNYYQFNGGTKWNNVRNEIRQQYRKNAYRVLLTRARQGMIIFVPKGDEKDHTRLPEFYNPTYEYLKSLGIKEI